MAIEASPRIEAFRERFIRPSEECSSEWYGGLAMSDNVPHRILLVDDNLEVLQVFQDMLVLSGYSVVAMQDGKEALHSICNDTFDLVITDFKMPVVSGLDIAYRVKENNPHTPVILISGTIKEIEGIALPENPIDLMLPKPIGWKEFIEAVTRMLQIVR